ncbi:MAG: hypothetical protein KAX15_01100 [Candidatus Omnitrophica bacterium]|nr:hypothetical protein [Candidatus Omnitrophota bacterium]
MPLYTDFPVYPTEVLNITDYPNQADDIDDVLGVLVNALRDEMIAVQTELGIVPKGSYADVKTRLNYYTAWQNYTQSAGRVSGGAVTDGGGGTADIAAGSGYFKTTDSETGVTVLLPWSLVEGLALVDNAVNYIHVNYNAGTPAVQTTTDRTTIELNREFTLARIFRSGTTLHIINSGVNLPNFAREEHERLLSVRGFERATGGEISETGTRNIASTAGRFYLGLNYVDTAAKDTAVADTFSSWYRDGAGGWTEVTAQTQIDNGYYDDGTGTLHALTANRYAVFWVYIHFDSDLHVIYGQGDYKLTDAENAVLPDSLPDQVQDFGTLAAKIIIKKNAAAFTSIVSAYKTLFPVSSPPDHNDLGGLQGGQANQYYHLNSTQHGNLGNFVTGPVYVDRGDPSSVDFDMYAMNIRGTWTDLDLSSIIPSGTVGVHVKMSMLPALAGTQFHLRKNGNTNSINTVNIHAAQATYQINIDGIVACDSDRKIEYYISAGFHTLVDLTIRGWWK